MKDFMLIFIGKSYAEMDLSPEKMQAQMNKWWEWSAKMKEDGVYKSGNALLPESFRHISGADRTVTDQTATELKEMVGGYYIVSAKDYDHAIEIAQGYPDYDFGGTVEVREVMVFNQ